MPNPLRIHKKLSGKHIVWFGESNQWVGFEVPAYKVYKWHEGGKKKKKIAKKITRIYGLEKKEARRFVKEIVGGIEDIKRMTVAWSQKPSARRKAQGSGLEAQEIIRPFSKRFYLINNKSISISYASKLLEYYFHPAILHHEIKNNSLDDVTFEIFAIEEEYILLKNGKEIAAENEIPVLKRMLHEQILDLIYETSPENWFTQIHASTVTNEKSAIILTSESGSGKSTLATLLQSRGLRVLSDDIVPMHRPDMQAYPVPTALSVKEGAYEVVSKYLPEFDPEKYDNYKYGSKKIRFFPPTNAADKLFDPMPVSSIVFTKYTKGADFHFSKLSDFDAFKRFHTEAWVDGSRENALTFIEWFLGLKCYELTFSDTDKAMDTIESLFRESK